MTTKNWSDIKRKIKRTLMIIMIIFVVILGFFAYFKYFYTYSNGYRAGLLQKFSHKGYVFKTYEGEIILSSVSSTNNVALASEKFYFSVTDKDLALQLDTLQGQFVIVHYKQKSGTLFWLGDSEYFVDGVKLRK
jgi:hypothetical protein